MKTPRTKKGFTLIELLVVIGIIALLASIALPAFTSVQVKAKQAKEISNVKQIGTLLKVYASDNNGNFPTNALDANLNPTGTPVGDSNSAFAQLFPAYNTNEQIFWTTNAGFGQTPPDNKIDIPMLQAHQYTLAGNECSWAYVLGLNETSDSRFPLVADAMTDKGAHTYIYAQNTVGGLWQGKAIVLNVDISAAIQKVNAADNTIHGSPLGADLFNTTEANWMSASNVVVNPLASGT